MTISHCEVISNYASNSENCAKKEPLKRLFFVFLKPGVLYILSNMKTQLPKLVYKDLKPTRDYLREISLILSSLQRVFLPKDAHDWHYGLEVNLRGLVTQPFMVSGQQTQASLDLVRQKVRLGGSAWRLGEYTAPEILNNVRVWLESHSLKAELVKPKFATDVIHFDSHQVRLYADSLWWMDEQFRWLKTTLDDGFTSPILFYPHHFDLSLVWFPNNDDKQLAIGFSYGDETIEEPYLYITAYPELPAFTKLTLPKPAYYQTTGFSGAILSYAKLSASPRPDKLFQKYANEVLSAARPLVD